MLSEEERSVVELAIDLLASDACLSIDALGTAGLRLSMPLGYMISAKEAEACGGSMFAHQLTVTPDERVMRLRKLLAADDVERSR